MGVSRVRKPAPLIPRLDGFVADGTVRLFGHALIPCNWLQIMENSVDAVHTEWLHGKLYEFIREKDNVQVAIAKRHLKIGFDECADRDHQAPRASSATTRATMTGRSGTR